MPSVGQTLASPRWNRHAKRASLLGRALHADRATVCLGDPPGQVESVAWAAAARFVELHAEVEDLAGVAGIDSDAVVAYGQTAAGRVGVAGEDDRPLALRPIVERKRVRDQRADRLAHLLLVAVDGRQIRRDFDPNAALLDEVVVLEQRLLDDLAQRLRTQCVR